MISLAIDFDQFGWNTNVQGALHHTIDTILSPTFDFRELNLKSDAKLPEDVDMYLTELKNDQFTVIPEVLRDQCVPVSYGIYNEYCRNRNKYSIGNTGTYVSFLFFLNLIQLILRFFVY